MSFKNQRLESVWLNDALDLKVFELRTLISVALILCFHPIFLSESNTKIFYLLSNSCRRSGVGAGARTQIGLDFTKITPAFIKDSTVEFIKILSWLPLWCKYLPVELYWVDELKIKLSFNVDSKRAWVHSVVENLMKTLILCCY